MVVGWQCLLKSMAYFAHRAYARGRLVAFNLMGRRCCHHQTSCPLFWPSFGRPYRGSRREESFLGHDRALYRKGHSVRRTAPVAKQFMLHDPRHRVGSNCFSSVTVRVTDVGVGGAQCEDAPVGILPIGGYFADPDFAREFNQLSGVDEDDTSDASVSAGDSVSERRKRGQRLSYVASGNISRRSRLTPAMEQYVRLKLQHPGFVLVFRMGDFYEMFFEDAVICSQVLGIALTTRGKVSDSGSVTKSGGTSGVGDGSDTPLKYFGPGERVPMSGVPYFALESHLRRLVDAGILVAICEQETLDGTITSPSLSTTGERGKARVESRDGAAGKKVVGRVVTRLVTPGTFDACSGIGGGSIAVKTSGDSASMVGSPANGAATDGSAQGVSSYLMAVQVVPQKAEGSGSAGSNAHVAMAWADVGTGETFVARVPQAMLIATIARVRPKEVVFENTDGISVADIRQIEEALLATAGRGIISSGAGEKRETVSEVIQRLSPGGMLEGVRQIRTMFPGVAVTLVAPDLYGNDMDDEDAMIMGARGDAIQDTHTRIALSGEMHRVWHALLSYVRQTHPHGEVPRLRPPEEFVASRTVAIDATTRAVLGILPDDGVAGTSRFDGGRGSAGASGLGLATTCTGIMMNSAWSGAMDPTEENQQGLTHGDAESMPLSCRSTLGLSSPTLFGVLKMTSTAMGARKLRARLSAPLTDVEAINDRLNAIDACLNAACAEQCRRILRHVGDIDRVLTRVVSGRATPDDVLMLRNSLGYARRLESLIDSSTPEKQGENGLRDMLTFPCASHDSVFWKLSDMFVHDVEETVEGARPLAHFLDWTRDKLPPSAQTQDTRSETFSEGDANDASSRTSFVRAGYDRILDELLEKRDRSHEVLKGLCERYKIQTGVKSLKIKHTAGYGHFFEVKMDDMPAIGEYNGELARKGVTVGEGRDDAEKSEDVFHHFQTLKRTARYKTSRLQALEGDLSRAAGEAFAREAMIFRRACKLVTSYADELFRVADAAASLDVALCLAQAADTYGYVRPQLSTGRELIVQGGRHPVVEAVGIRRGEPFVANDIDMCHASGEGDVSSPAFCIVTGANMGGKSTFLRQNALIVLMAQIGSFVPADSARIGVVDSIFARVGASDDLVHGQSTFMVEMNEVARILRHCGPRSLVIIDEIGRGTDSEDGFAIASAVASTLCKDKPLGACDQPAGTARRWRLQPRVQADDPPRVLFSTHFHNLHRVLEERACDTQVWQVEAIVRPGVDEGAESSGRVGSKTNVRAGDVVFTHRVVPGAAVSSFGFAVAELAGVPLHVIEDAYTLRDARR